MLDPQEEKRFDDLKAMCRELKVPAPPEIMIGLKVHDHNGMLTFDDVQRGHSWTRNYWNFLFSQSCSAGLGGVASFGAGYMSNKTTGASLQSSANTIICSYGKDLTAGDGVGIVCTKAYSIQGIVVGTSGAAFSVDHYTLQGLISTGSGGGQLNYVAMGVGSISYNAGTKLWSRNLSRIYNNNSGNSITVSETGLYAQTDQSGTSGYSMEERSVLNPTVAVANGAQLTVTYSISMDFSAID